MTSRLRELCVAMESGADDLLDQHEALLHSALPRHAQAIIEAVRGFDFEIAVERLDEAILSRPTVAW